MVQLDFHVWLPISVQILVHIFLSPFSCYKHLKNPSISYHAYLLSLDQTFTFPTQKMANDFTTASMNACTSPSRQRPPL